MVVDLRLMSVCALGDRGRRCAVEASLGELGDRRFEQQIANVVTVAPARRSRGFVKGHVVHDRSDPFDFVSVMTQ